MTVGGVSSANNYNLHGHPKRRTFSPKFLHSLHEQLKLEKKAAEFKGEVLGYMLDSNAQPIGGATFQLIQERMVYVPAINLLRNVMLWTGIMVLFG